MPQMRVRYKGAADRREMSVDDLAQHGVNVSKDLVWNRANLWRLDLDVDDQLESILKQDGAFRLEAINDDGSVTREHEGQRTDDTGTTVVDATTGATSTTEPHDA